MRKRNINSNAIVSKHVPQRTCVVCRKVTAKQELIRLVRDVYGSVDIDSSGRKAGRGAYLCRSRECWEAGLKSGQLEHALRTTFTHGKREQLIRHGMDLLQRELISG